MLFLNCMNYDKIFKNIVEKFPENQLDLMTGFKILELLIETINHARSSSWANDAASIEAGNH